MATIVDALAVELSLDPAKFKKGISDAIDDLKKFKDASEKHGKDIDDYSKKQADGFGLITKKIGELAAAYLSFTAVKSFVTDLINTNVQLNNTAAALGISTEKLSAMGNMARMVGSSAQGMAGAIGNIQRELVNMNQYHLPPSQDFQIGANQLRIPLSALRGNATPESVILAIARAGQSQLRSGVSQAVVSDEYRKMGIQDPGLISAMSRLEPEKLAAYLKEMEKYAPTAADTKRVMDFNMEMGRLEAIFGKMQSTMSPLLDEMGPFIRLLEDVLKLVNFMAHIEKPSWWPTVGESLPIIGPIISGVKNWDKYMHPGGTGSSSATAPGSEHNGVAPLGSGAGGRPNYFQNQGMQPPDRSDLSTVKTPYGDVVAHPQAAEDVKGFFNFLYENGAPLKSIGSYNKRGKAFGSGWSSHAYGAAFDMDDNRYLSPAMKHWIETHPSEWAEAQKRFHMSEYMPQKDPGHIEWTGPGGGLRTVKGSTFDDAMTAAGPKTGEPGIALPNKSTMGQWFKVTAPNGKTYVLRQTDVGPAASTGRGIDINAEARKQMGYSEGGFPTDHDFSYEPYGKPATPQKGSGSSGSSWYKNLWDSMKGSADSIAEKLRGTGSHSPIGPQSSYHPSMLRSNSAITNNNTSTTENNVGYNVTIQAKSDPRGIADAVDGVIKNRVALMNSNNISGGPGLG